ncbi:MAG: hypothetical protein N2C14_19595 [Planctomycetales bacterium]
MRPIVRISPSTMVFVSAWLYLESTTDYSKISYVVYCGWVR